MQLSRQGTHLNTSRLQSPGSMSGTLEVDTCTSPGFSTRLFVLTECPSYPTVTSGNLVLVGGDTVLTTAHCLKR